MKVYCMLECILAGLLLCWLFFVLFTFSFSTQKGFVVFIVFIISRRTFYVWYYVFSSPSELFAPPETEAPNTAADNTELDDHNNNTESDDTKQ